MLKAPETGLGKVPFLQHSLPSSGSCRCPSRDQDLCPAPRRAAPACSRSTTAMWGQAAAFHQNRFLPLRTTCALSRQQLLTDKTRQAEAVIASRLHVHRLFFALVLLPHSSRSPPRELRRALKTKVPCKALPKVCASRGAFGHKESSCHLGKQDTTIKLGLGLINWSQHESEFSSSGLQLQ